MKRLLIIPTLLMLYASVFSQTKEDKPFQVCNSGPSDTVVWGTDRVNNNEATDVDPELPRFKKDLKKLLPEAENSWGLAYSTFGGRNSSCVELHTILVYDAKSFSVNKPVKVPIIEGFKTKSPGTLDKLIRDADFKALKKGYNEKSPACFECPTKRLEIYRVNAKGKREFYRFEWIGLSKNAAVLREIYSEAMRIS